MGYERTRATERKLTGQTKSTSISESGNLLQDRRTAHNVAGLNSIIMGLLALTSCIVVRGLSESPFRRVFLLLIPVIWLVEKWWLGKVDPGNPIASDKKRSWWIGRILLTAIFASISLLCWAGWFYFWLSGFPRLSMAPPLLRAGIYIFQLAHQPMLSIVIFVTAAPFVVWFLFDNLAELFLGLATMQMVSAGAFGHGTGSNGDVVLALLAFFVIDKGFKKRGTHSGKSRVPNLNCA